VARYPDEKSYWRSVKRDYAIYALKSTELVFLTAKQPGPNQNYKTLFKDARRWFPFVLMSFPKYDLPE